MRIHRRPQALRRAMVRGRLLVFAVFGVGVLVACFFLLGSALRVVLYVFNPPFNAYDDHFEPVMLWIRAGGRPAAASHRL